MPDARHRPLFVVGLVFATLETGMIWWRVGAAPLAWICLLWTAVALALCVADRSALGRMLWPNVAAALLAIGGVEGALHISKARNPYLLPSGVRFVGDLARPNYFIEMPADGLGYRPRPAMQILAVKQQDNTLIYRARYSVDGNGLRKSPPMSEAARACVLMFGDSMAWGEGVDDEDTAAFQIGALSGGAVRVANFAFTGYSAHQMLWQIRSGMVNQASGCDPAQPVLAIYQTLPNNVARVAGLRGWDQYGPRYLLAPGGRLRYAGSFARGDYVLHDKLFIPALLSEQLGRINLYSRIFGRDRKPDRFDYERFTTVVRASADGLRASYPHLRFLVVVWPEPPDSKDSPQSEAGLLLASLKAQGLAARSVSEVIPWYRVNPAAAGIPGDGHPNPAAQGAIARYFVPVVERWIQDWNNGPEVGRVTGSKPG